ncbi:TIGR01906 family membrane protein [Streptococcus sp. HF-1907]|uniref:TIGR01906 family membrane protein n=1 Tax=Streptococcus sp. HF-1907 TaxID=2785793 RepID=UPI0018A0CAEB|nr:TIGR01906 family membrane protein [Streptococcus sp. HF-1907]MBF7093849.1 TIGR01906 family membrane protein [Streptococcus sp. HF-1907]
MKDKLLAGLTWLWLLSLAIVATIYFAWVSYPLEISWQGLEKVVFLEAKTISYNFNILMTYLTNPFSHVLDMPSFPSSKAGLAHFADVKLLFHLAQAVFLVLAWPSCHFLRKHLKQKSLFLFKDFFLGTSLLPIVIAIMAFLIGFDNFFTVFHNILFPGKSNWLFDPLQDSVIWILPETFFLHCFILFFILYEVAMLTCYWLGRKQLQARLS